MPTETYANPPLSDREALSLIVDGADFLCERERNVYLLVTVSWHVVDYLIALDGDDPLEDDDPLEPEPDLELDLSDFEPDVDDEPDYQRPRGSRWPLGLVVVPEVQVT